MDYEMNIDQSTKIEPVSTDYVLKQIEKIMQEREYLQQIVEEISKIESNAQYKARALEEVVRQRETTNRQILCLYEKMYEHAVADPEAEKHLFHQQVLETAETAINNGCLDEFEQIVDALLKD